MLNEINRNNPFAVPEDYFQDFNSQIIRKLSVEGTSLSEKKNVSIKKTTVKWLSIAAILSGILLTGVSYFYNDTTSAAILKGSAASLSNNVVVGKVDESDEYYEFIEEEATYLAYKEAFFADDSF